MSRPPEVFEPHAEAADDVDRAVAALPGNDHVEVGEAGAVRAAEVTGVPVGAAVMAVSVA